MGLLPERSVAQDNGATSARGHAGFSRRFNLLSQNWRFLTRPDPISMVRAALERRRSKLRSSAKGAGVASNGRLVMADGARNDEDRGTPAGDEADLSARLRRLGERLDKVQASRPPDSSHSASRPVDSSAMARGLRLSTELVGAVLLGAAIGWLLDRWLGSSPWGLIVLLLLGFAAGILNVMRAAGVVSSGQENSR